MKIYVASSFRNTVQPLVVEALRLFGHEVYDYRNPAPGEQPFSWKEVLPQGTDIQDADGYLRAIRHPVAVQNFDRDMTALRECDACVLVLPCGRSAHLEAGWALGAGKPLWILLDRTNEPELMYRMALEQAADVGVHGTVLSPSLRDLVHSLADYRINHPGFGILSCQCPICRGDHAAQDRLLEIFAECERPDGCQNAMGREIAEVSL